MHAATHMEDFVTNLFRRYGAEQTNSGRTLSLQLRDYGILIVHEKNRGTIVHLDLEEFYEEGEPTNHQIIYIWTGGGIWAPYVLADKSGTVVHGKFRLSGEFELLNEAGQKLLATHTDHLALRLNQEGWLTVANKIAT